MNEMNLSTRNLNERKLTAFCAISLKCFEVIYSYLQIFIRKLNV